ncbi:MAG: hypothetical protein HKP58_09595 [Desulfatitalea sp.]|nr:hypothetical protein [Desulfatitalea sp.]NNK00655.1 hypothetical protein [Desulfatitalea sp.]
MAQIAEIVDKESVIPFISERLPLSKLASAHEKMRQTHGKVLILVNWNR